LINHLFSERFIRTGFIFKQIFELISPLTKFLQGVNIDLLGASEYVKLILEKNSSMNELSFTPLSLNRIRKK